MLDKTRPVHPRRTTKVCSRTVRATFIAYGSLVKILKPQSPFLCVSARFLGMGHHTDPRVLFYGSFYTTEFVSDSKGPSANEILWTGTPFFLHA